MENRGLNQSDNLVVKLLKKSTNDFLDKLDLIIESNKSKESKLDDINEIIDNLPWIELDTEEKEFLADVIAPAIESAGFNPWSII